MFHFCNWIHLVCIRSDQDLYCSLTTSSMSLNWGCMELSLSIAFPFTLYCPSQHLQCLSIGIGVVSLHNFPFHFVQLPHNIFNVSQLGLELSLSITFLFTLYSSLTTSSMSLNWDWSCLSP